MELSTLAGIATAVLFVAVVGLVGRYSRENAVIVTVGVALVFTALMWTDPPSGLRVLLGALGGGLITRAADRQQWNRPARRNESFAERGKPTVSPG